MRVEAHVVMDIDDYNWTVGELEDEITGILESSFIVPVVLSTNVIIDE